MGELSYEERLEKCGLVSLELRRLRKDLAICYQIINGLISLNFKDFFYAGYKLQNSWKSTKA